MQNKSLNEQFVDETDVPTEDTIMNIPSLVSEGYSGYKFQIMPIKKSPKMACKISLDPKHAICSLCLNIWHDVVTVSPCLHNFCNECFSEWSRSQEEHAIVLCPHCSSDVQSVGRNRSLHEIEKRMRKSDSSPRRSNEEPLIKSLPVIKHGKKPRSKRSRLMREEVNIGTNLGCAECGTDYGGFECNKNTVHLECHACGNMMPLRTDIVVPQHCEWSTYSLTT
ncbi:E3 ubiquitin protein ligase DRIP1-like [Bidens hawaiensis]|uniref:E3 ubiquitin protein ligase DRIP1-like n=1 Tax=Bidens hawaiensis TaxID=980011 RepID=UPI00404A6912